MSVLDKRIEGLGKVIFNGKEYWVEKIINYPNKHQEIFLFNPKTMEDTKMEYIPNEMGKRGWRE